MKTIFEKIRALFLPMALCFATLTGSSFAQAQLTHNNFPPVSGFIENHFDQSSSQRYGYIGYQEARRLVILIYRGVLGRNPDPGGLNSAMDVVLNQGEQGVIDVAVSMAYSQEFQERVYRVGGREIVRNMYKVFFNRGMDPGANQWIQSINQGYYDYAIHGVVASEEFANKHFFNR